jgi:hypothetical protein
MAALPPGARAVGPEAEAERLAAGRRPRSSVLLDEVHQIRAGNRMVLVGITLTSREQCAVPHDLGQKIAALIQENWPAGEVADA